MTERVAGTLPPHPGPPAAGPALPTTYANVFRASGSAEELILDFGLDPPRHSPEDAEPAVMLQRLVLGWRTAGRLLVALQELLRHHEKALASARAETDNRPNYPVVSSRNRSRLVSHSQFVPPRAPCWRSCLARRPARRTSPAVCLA